ncbi:hypothetical protein HDU84_009516 [Entophlyctis sp. JEL0112]|nr:hypothetical protein HDU84_009516 [Entophlyctis sp. JEL0112]
MHCIGGTATADPRSVIYRYDIRNDTWITPATVASPLTDRVGHSCTILNDLFYVFGGTTRNGADVATTFFSFNVTSSVTATLTAPDNRYGHQLVSIPSTNELLLLFGAQLTNLTAQLPTLKYSIDQNEWSTLTTTSATTLLETLDGASCTSWSSTVAPTGGVFCFGGETPSHQPNPHLTYLNLSTSTWTDLGIPSNYQSGEGTFGATVSVLDGGHFVTVKFGGQSSTGTVAAYTSQAVTCSNDSSSGAFFGIPMTGPTTSGGSEGGFPIGWTVPAIGGFPIVNSSTATTTTATATAVVPATTDSGNEGSSQISGWKLALAILFPILLVLCCSLGMWWYCCFKKGRGSTGTATVPAHQNMETAVGSIPPAASFPTTPTPYSMPPYAPPGNLGAADSGAPSIGPFIPTVEPRLFEQADVFKHAFAKEETAYGEITELTSYNGGYESLAPSSSGVVAPVSESLKEAVPATLALGAGAVVAAEIAANRAKAKETRNVETTTTTEVKTYNVRYTAPTPTSSDAEVHVSEVPKEAPVAIAVAAGSVIAAEIAAKAVEKTENKRYVETTTEVKTVKTEHAALTPTPGDVPVPVSEVPKEVPPVSDAVIPAIEETQNVGTSTRIKTFKIGHTAPKPTSILPANEALKETVLATATIGAGAIIASEIAANRAAKPEETRHVEAATKIKTYKVGFTSPIPKSTDTEVNVSEVPKKAPVTLGSLAAVSVIVAESEEGRVPKTAETRHVETTTEVKTFEVGYNTPIPASSEVAVPVSEIPKEVPPAVEFTPKPEEVRSVEPSTRIKTFKVGYTAPNAASSDVVPPAKEPLEDVLLTTAMVGAGTAIAAEIVANRVDKPEEVRSVETTTKIKTFKVGYSAPTPKSSEVVKETSMPVASTILDTVIPAEIETKAEETQKVETSTRIKSFKVGYTAPIPTTSDIPVHMNENPEELPLKPSNITADIGAKPETSKSIDIFVPTGDNQSSEFTTFSDAALPLNDVESLNEKLVVKTKKKVSFEVEEVSVSPDVAPPVRLETVEEIVETSAVTEEIKDETLPTSASSSVPKKRIVVTKKVVVEQKPDSVIAEGLSKEDIPQDPSSESSIILPTVPSQANQLPTPSESPPRESVAEVSAKPAKGFFESIWGVLAPVRDADTNSAAGVTFDLVEKPTIEVNSSKELPAIESSSYPSVDLSTVIEQKPDITSILTLEEVNSQQAVVVDLLNESRPVIVKDREIEILVEKYEEIPQNPVEKPQVQSSSQNELPPSYFQVDALPEAASGSVVVNIDREIVPLTVSAGDTDTSPAKTTVPSVAVESKSVSVDFGLPQYTEPPLAFDVSRSEPKDEVIPVNILENVPDDSKADEPAFAVVTETEERVPPVRKQFKITKTISSTLEDSVVTDASEDFSRDIFNSIRAFSDPSVIAKSVSDTDRPIAAENAEIRIPEIIVTEYIEESAVKETESILVPVVRDDDFSLEPIEKDIPVEAAEELSIIDEPTEASQTVVSQMKSAPLPSGENTVRDGKNIVTQDIIDDAIANAVEPSKETVVFDVVHGSVSASEPHLESTVAPKPKKAFKLTKSVSVKEVLSTVEDVSVLPPEGQTDGSVPIVEKEQSIFVESTEDSSTVELPPVPSGEVLVKKTELVASEIVPPETVNSEIVASVTIISETIGSSEVPSQKEVYGESEAPPIVELPGSSESGTANSTVGRKGFKLTKFAPVSNAPAILELKELPIEKPAIPADAREVLIPESAGVVASEVVSSTVISSSISPQKPVPAESEISSVDEVPGISEDSTSKSTPGRRGFKLTKIAASSNVPAEPELFTEKSTVTPSAGELVWEKDFISESVILESLASSEVASKKQESEKSDIAGTIDLPHSSESVTVKSPAARKGFKLTKIAPAVNVVLEPDVKELAFETSTVEAIPAPSVAMVIREDASEPVDFKPVLLSGKDSSSDSDIPAHVELPLNSESAREKSAPVRKAFKLTKVVPTSNFPPELGPKELPIEKATIELIPKAPEEVLIREVSSEAVVSNEVAVEKQTAGELDVPLIAELPPSSESAPVKSTARKGFKLTKIVATSNAQEPTEVPNEKPILELVPTATGEVIIREDEPVTSETIVTDETIVTKEIVSETEVPSGPGHTSSNILELIATSESATVNSAQGVEYGKVEATSSVPQEIVLKQFSLEKQTVDPVTTASADVTIREDAMVDSSIVVSDTIVSTDVSQEQIFEESDISSSKIELPAGSQSATVKAATGRKGFKLTKIAAAKSSEPNVQERLAELLTLKEKDESLNIDSDFVEPPIAVVENEAEKAFAEKVVVIPTSTDKATLEVVAVGDEVFPIHQEGTETDAFYLISPPIKPREEKLYPSSIPRLKPRKHVKTTLVKQEGLAAIEDRPFTPAASEPDQQADVAESKAQLVNAAPQGWLNRMIKKLSEISPSFDMSKFSSSMAEIPVSVVIDEEVIRSQLANAGAALTDVEFMDIVKSINNQNPKRAQAAFEAISDAASRVGPEVFIAKVLPEVLEPSPEELFWIKKIRAAAPGDWWPRFLRQVGKYSPEFDLIKFMTKLGSKPFVVPEKSVPLPMVTDENILKAFAESNAKFTAKQFYRVKEAIVPGKPLVATSAFKAMVDAVHTIGIKALISGVLPSLGMWVADKKPASLAVATIENSGPEGWFTRFLKKIAETSPSFDVTIFAQSMAQVPSDVELSEAEIIDLLNVSGAKIDSSDLANVLASISGDNPQEATFALKSLGAAYRTIGDNDEFMFEIVPSVLASNLDDIRVIERLKKCAPGGWWIRFLESIYYYAPDFDLYVFLLGLSSTALDELDSPTVLNLLSKANAPLVISEFEQVEARVSRNQKVSPASIYRTLAECVQQTGPSEFLAVVSPILAKRPATLKRSRLIRVVAAKDQVSEAQIKDLTEATVDSSRSRSRRSTLRYSFSSQTPENEEESISNSPTKPRSRQSTMRYTKSTPEPGQFPQSVSGQETPSTTSSRRNSGDVDVRPSVPFRLITSKQARDSPAHVLSSIREFVPVDPNSPDLESEFQIAEARSTLERAAPEGWFDKMMKKLSEIAPSLDFPQFVITMSEIPSFVNVTDELIQEELRNSGAALTEAQYIDLCQSINGKSPDDACVAFEALAESAGLVGPEAFVTRIVPAFLEPSADELYWIRRIKSAAPGNWWPRFLRKIGEFAPEFDLALFISKIKTEGKMDDATLMRRLGDCNASLSVEQFDLVKESIVPGKHLVAIKAFETVSEAVRKLGVKRVLSGVLPSLGLWVAERRPQITTIASVSNAGPVGWLSRFLRHVAKLSPSFDVQIFAESLAKLDKSLDVNESLLRDALGKAGAHVSDEQLNLILTAVSPEEPSSAFLAFKTLGSAYAESSNPTVFMREVLPAVLTPDAEELEVIDTLQKTPPSGWWARFLDGVSLLSPNFDLLAFARELSEIPPNAVTSDVILRILGESNANLSSKDLESIEEEMVSGQSTLILPAYAVLAESISKAGPVSFVNIISPVLAKAEKKVQRRNRILKIVPVKAQPPKGIVESKSSNSKKTSLREVLSPQIATKATGKRGSFVSSYAGPELMRSPSRGSYSEDPRFAKQKSSPGSSGSAPQRMSISDDPRLKPKTRISEINTEAESPEIVKPRSSVISFRDSRDGAIVQPVVAMVKRASLVSVDELFPLEETRKEVTRRTSASSSLVELSMNRVERRKSFLEYLTDNSSASSGKSKPHLRPRVESPEDTVAAHLLVLKYHDVVSRGWWAHVVSNINARSPSFDPYAFINKLGEVKGSVSDEKILAILYECGATITPDHFDEIMILISGSREKSSKLLMELPAIISSFGARRFYYKILPLWSNADNVEPLDFKVSLIPEPESLNLHCKDGVEIIHQKYSEFNPEVFAFIHECEKISPAFSIFKFLDSFSTVQKNMTEEKIHACFKFANLETSQLEEAQLMTTLLGFWDLEGLYVFAVNIRRIGVSKFLAHVGDLSTVTIDQSKHAGRIWISSINDIGPKAKFDPVGFQNSCRILDPVFSMETFLQKLAACDDISSESDIRRLLLECGLNLSDQDYAEIVTNTCGSVDYAVEVFRSWWLFVLVWGPGIYWETIDTVLDEHATRNALVMTFLGRVYALGANVQFDLHHFVSKCRSHNREFSLQKWCNCILKITRLEQDSLHEAFVLSGIDLDRRSTEYAELLVALFGDYSLHMTAMRELHYLLKKLGSEWAVIYMMAIVKQRQQVEKSVSAFKAEIKEIPMMVKGKLTTLRFTMRSFIERCKFLQSGWHSDEDFDLRGLLEKLSKTEEFGDISEKLIVTFKACGLNTTLQEYENLVGSIAGEDYASGLVVFKLLLKFLKKWGMEWNMWIVWSLLDDKEHNEDEMMRFMLNVKEFGKDAKFDFLGFTARCESLENSWHSGDGVFNIEVFINQMLNIQGKVSLASMEQVFRLCGIRTVSQEYKDLCVTLTGGDFESTSVPVITYWVSFLKLWGVQWFLRAASIYFDQLQRCEKEIERLENSLSLLGNRLDVRTFEWICLSKNGGFKLVKFLESLVNCADDLSQSVINDLLANEGVDIPEAEFAELIAVLTSADGADGYHVINDWVAALRVCGVKYYDFMWRMQCLWLPADSEGSKLCIRAFHSKILVVSPKFSVANLFAACQKYRSDWDIVRFVAYLADFRGELTLAEFQTAFKDTKIDVSADATLDLLADLSGDRDTALFVSREWVLAARISGAKEMVEHDLGPITDKKSQSESWLSRAIRVVATGAEAAVGVVTQGAETAVHAVEDIIP